MMEGLKVHTTNLRWIALGLFAVLVSCNGQKKTVMDSNLEDGDHSVMTLLLQDSYAPTESVETIVVRDAESLKKFFGKVNRTRKPGIPVPEVDFSKDMVIIYCAGNQKDGAFPELSKVADTDGQMVLGIVQKKQEKQKTSAAVTSPFSIYKMPITKKEIIFQKIK